MGARAQGMKGLNLPKMGGGGGFPCVYAQKKLFADLNGALLSPDSSAS